ncbi:2-hydroxyacylsphingosine 1-beta-galactosyltransferase [Electrophorus electricus]|uniref:2-hydroxyacylsphingosine 1-beta-galactosyltransferase n=1 Tax=Electrophorus electricus TaxID=8005 RepID=A0A4W4HAG7_ELEEL|nr:2-hydroxyacylsphingosine 1-beta-galactosyltransferase [Electrophorus electricus]XP_035386228.1 2-hydroxyacylsphingosine 1-beta-galactosyltransferase [Electrophorus electricus]XP_035386229.1 2-hydroxyacylsphingosine 1-beta-galactosyltransferase [Electrophorus electricus]XP_035386231.1 2-hydroxyacylsphingosine 1-beta-galactosyltransferase [Electrophorus electricus]
MRPPPALLSMLLLWCLLPAPSSPAKIVVVPPIMFESHLYIFKTLASALHAEGHDTVFLVSEGREVPQSAHYRLQRYPGIFNSSTADAFLQAKVRNIFSGRLTPLELFDILEHYSRNCDSVVASGDAMARLRAEHFDLLLVDPNEMCGFVLAHMLAVPYAVFSTGLWYPAEVGAPAPLAYVPEFNSLLTDRMTLAQRAANAAVYLLSRLGVQLLVLPKYERIMRRHGVRPAVSMHELVQGSRLWMLCTDMALEFPRPTLPHVVYVGGILTKPPGPLPQEFDAWVNDTDEHGFVVVSFGAGVKYLSDDIAHKLAGALRRLPQRVIWRFSGVPPSNLGNNTKLVEWMPQNDLLGHRNTRAFLSHGGLNSIYEAMYHGVPVVGVPLFGDHYDTMTRVQAKGMGIMLEWKRMTEEDLHSAMVSIITDHRYRESAHRLSVIHKDQPGHPVTRAVYWIDYILRHHGAEHLRAAVYSIPTYQYFLLDVVMLTGAALLLTCYCVYRIGRFLRLRLSGGGATAAMANGHCHNGVANGKHKRNGHSKSTEKKLK